MRVIIRNQSKLHSYWQNPTDEKNFPSQYLQNENTSKRSRLIVDMVKKCGIPEDASIIELGCNVGRNLNALHESGFVNLHGIDISSQALDVGEKEFGLSGKNIRTRCCTIEEFLGNAKKKSYDVIFTLAVLEHLAIESEWVFPCMVNVSNGYIVTVEDEISSTWRIHPRQYGEVFQELGCREIYSRPCDKEFDNLSGDHFVARVFKVPVDKIDD